MTHRTASPPRLSASLPRWRRLSLTGFVASAVLFGLSGAAAYRHYRSVNPQGLELLIPAPVRPFQCRPVGAEQAQQPARSMAAFKDQAAPQVAPTYFTTAFDAEIDREIPAADSPVVIGAFPGAGRGLLQFLPNAWAATDRNQASVSAAIAAKGLVRLVPTGRSAARSLAYSPDARYLAIASGGRIRLWDTGRGFEVRRLSGHDGPVWSVDWSADGRSIAAAGSDGTVRLWDAIEARPTAVFRSHGGIASVVAFSPDSRHVASVADDGSVAVAELASRTVRKWSGHDGAVLALAFLGTTGRIATVGEDGTLRTWDAVAGTLLSSVVLDSVPLCVRSLRDGEHLLTGHADGRIVVRDVQTGRPVRSLSMQGEAVVYLAVATDESRLATTDAAGRVRLWNLAQGTLLATNDGERAKPTCLAFAPDGNDVACGGIDELIRVWTPPAAR